MGALLAYVNVVSARQTSDVAADATSQEKQCLARGWQRVEMQVAGLLRELLWKARAGPWSRGAIVVLHGGGGQRFQSCVASAPAVTPQRTPQSCQSSLAGRV